MNPEDQEFEDQEFEAVIETRARTYTFTEYLDELRSSHYNVEETPARLAKSVKAQTAYPIYEFIESLTDERANFSIDKTGTINIQARSWIGDTHLTMEHLVALINEIKKKNRKYFSIDTTMQKTNRCGIYYTKEQKAKYNLKGLEHPNLKTEQ